jgi:hypothetical protein
VARKIAQILDEMERLHSASLSRTFCRQALSNSLGGDDNDVPNTALEVSTTTLTHGLIGPSQQYWTDETSQPIRSLTYVGWVQDWRVARGNRPLSVSPLSPFSPFTQITTLLQFYQNKIPKYQNTRTPEHKTSGKEAVSEYAASLRHDSTLQSARYSF